MTAQAPDLYEIASGLLDCACTALQPDCPKTRCVVPGLEVEWNCCTDGQLAINLVSGWPSRSFPIPDVASTNCDIPFFVYTFRITLLRCVAVQAEPTPCITLADQAARQLRDVQLVANGLVCCLTDVESMSCLLGAGYRWVLSTLQTLGPEGGCVGFSQDIVVGVPMCWECCP